MNHININGKKYSLNTLKLLTGQKELDIEKIPDNILVIAQAIDDPDELPYLIETIKSLEIDNKEKFRFALFRVQIDAQLHMDEDLMRYQKCLFVSQVIEMLLYEELYFETVKKEEDEEEE
ncbi:hypothetical protein ANME2D_00578 [Candidatus Methanoperedens nitroreducens]|uniref:Uncharacterized protein n=1 Tax=Candidatus Methanoperedens nitratireducens TaxID=1392998 RepID=A0A062VE95_9EURY|nr:hypothetical protein [Candidatus Methanoperedens nitroreducens]KCZ73510.1 hypothetical protein ANME2D_00578 [Candidatus Methanoperedens nitroreducens]MDJ1422534.1 hypothetical protein [Candidatus Methanoperedens sp.]